MKAPIDTASSLLLAVSIVSVCSTIAWAETRLSLGLAAGEQQTPFLGLTLDEAWVLESWNVTLDLEARGEFDKGFGDTVFNTEWHADTRISKSLALELDAAYAFDRERTEAIKQVHTLGADIGASYEANKFLLKADLGLIAGLHENTTQSGFASLDRSMEDYVESDAALRLTLAPRSPLQPFLEVAHIRREYTIESGRSFQGPEAVVGVTLESAAISGDVGVIFTSRRLAGERSKHVIGPYVDLKWLLRPNIEISMSMLSGLDQDTSGGSELFRSHSARIEVSNSFSERTTLSAVLDAVIEERSSGTETEISPSFKVRHDTALGHGYFAAAGLTYTRIDNVPFDVAPTLELGMSWNW